MSTLEKVDGLERACVDPCSTSWDDWCEQTNNDGKACGASPDDKPCLSKTCKCTAVGKVVAAPPLEKKDCASKTYVVRTDTPVDPTMTWLICAGATPRGSKPPSRLAPLRRSRSKWT